MSATNDTQSINWNAHLKSVYIWFKALTHAADCVGRPVKLKLQHVLSTMKRIVGGHSCSIERASTARHTCK